MTRPGIEIDLTAARRLVVDHYRVNIPDESVNESLRAAAEAHGRTVEEEISAIVMKHAPEKPDPPAYPPGYEPLPGESFVQHIIRVSRPGFEIELPERGLFELRDPFDNAG